MDPVCLCLCPIVKYFMQNRLAKLNLHQVSCSSMDCTASVSGSTQPNLIDSCCSQFQPGVCNSPTLQSFPAMGEVECQRRCRTDKDCLFYSSSTNSCILHSSCPPERAPCLGCKSGAKRPPLDKLPNNCGNNGTTTTTTATTTSTGWQLTHKKSLNV